MLAQIIPVTHRPGTFAIRLGIAQAADSHGVSPRPVARVRSAPAQTVPGPGRHERPTLHFHEARSHEQIT